MKHIILFVFLFAFVGCSAEMGGSLPPTVDRQDLSCGQDTGPTGFDGPACIQTGQAEYVCPVDYEGALTNIPQAKWLACSSEPNKQAPHCMIYLECK